MNKLNVVESKQTTDVMDVTTVLILHARNIKYMSVGLLEWWGQLQVQIIGWTLQYPQISAVLCKPAHLDNKRPQSAHFSDLSE